MTLRNSKGSVYYGMHFYPGVAEYKELGIRVFVNEDTIRSMGPTMEGRPVYVFHKDGDVPTDLDTLKNEADGWVISSFFNEADGKHWTKFIVCTEKGEQAVRRGYCLSNAYSVSTFGPGGEHNGVSYNKEVKGGVYDHLAIVPDPRYEESVIMTPDQFKNYNESKRIELTKLANNNGGAEVKLNLFKKVKVEKLENSADVENLVVVLPKSGKEMTVTELVNAADQAETAKGKPKLANGADTVTFKVGDEEQTMTVLELQNAYVAKCENESDDDEVENAEDDEVENAEDDEVENAEDDEKAKADEEHDEKAVDDAKKKPVKNKKPMKNDKGESQTEREARLAKANRLRNAHERGNRDEYAPEPLSFDPTQKVALGKARYGS